jgi:hypothetical protein
MGKTIFIATSLILVVLSVYIYATQTEPKSAEDGGAQVIKARLTSYDAYRYKGDAVIARASGQKATFLDQGRLVCEERVKLVRRRGGLREEVEAKSAEIHFPSSSLFSAKNNNAESIDLRGDVEIIRGSSRFLTDWIHYSDKTAEAFTDKPVRLEQDGQFIAAEQGMTYNMRTDSIRMRGGVFGSLQPQILDGAISKPQDSGKSKKRK